MKLNMLTPMITEDQKMVFMDFTSGKTYELKTKIKSVEDTGKNCDELDINFYLAEVCENISQSCFEDVEKLQESLMPDIPTDKIREVLSTEKNLSEQNEKHIFRRNA
jgi:hypothetical protein